MQKKGVAVKNIVICTNIDDESFDSLGALNKYFKFEDLNVHLLHLWSIQSYSYQGDMIVPFYPNQAQSEEITKKMEKALNDQINAFKGIKKENFHVAVKTSESPKRESVEFLKENNADLVVSITPQKSAVGNFFHSSFTNYLAAHAHCDLLMIRQKKS